MLAALLLTACGPPGGAASSSETEAPAQAVAVAPECHEVDRLVAEAPDGVEPTGTTAEPVRDESLPSDAPRDSEGGPPVAGPAPQGLPPQIDQWGLQEAPESFAGVWVDHELGGFSVAFAHDVERYAEEVRERFHPGLGIAEALHSSAELREIEQRIRQEDTGERGDSGAVLSTGTYLMINRTSVRVFDPDAERLAELSRTYGTDAICFEIEAAPQSPAEGVRTLAKASGWRDGLDLTGRVDTWLEIAYDRETAQRAWAENVPDDLPGRDADPPAEPGLYAGLEQVDFERQAVVVWSSGESGSCPEWLVDIELGRAGGVRLVTDATADECTSDFRAYRLVLAVDRNRLPQPDEVSDARITDRRGAQIRAYPGSGR